MCLVFEPDSIAPRVPLARFAVDPGHPICDPKDYAAHGHTALCMARVWYQAAKPKSVHMTTWDQVESFLGPSAPSNELTLRELNPTDAETDEVKRENSRYDVILKTGQSAFIANGVAVVSHKSLKILGYDHAGGFF